MEKPPERQIIAEHVRQPDDRMRRQVKGEVHPGGGHAGTAGPEKARLEAGVPRLVIQRRAGFGGGELPAQCPDQLRGQQVPAGLPRHYHEALGLHGERKTLSGRLSGALSNRPLVDKVSDKVCDQGTESWLLGPALNGALRAGRCGRGEASAARVAAGSSRVCCGVATIKAFNLFRDQSQSAEPAEGAVDLFGWLLQIIILILLLISDSFGLRLGAGLRL